MSKLLLIIGVIALSGVMFGIYGVVVGICSNNWSIILDTGLGTVFSGGASISCITASRWFRND